MNEDVCIIIIIILFMYIIISISIIFIIIIIIVIMEKGRQCKTERECNSPQPFWTLSVKRQQPSCNIYPQKERRVRENSRRQKGSEQLSWIKKTMALLLKPASPTPSITGSPTSFLRDNLLIIGTTDYAVFSQPSYGRRYHWWPSAN